MLTDRFQNLSDLEIFSLHFYYYWKQRGEQKELLKLPAGSHSSTQHSGPFKGGRAALNHDTTSPECRDRCCPLHKTRTWRLWRPGLISCSTRSADVTLLAPIKTSFIQNCQLNNNKEATPSAPHPYFLENVYFVYCHQQLGGTETETELDNHDNLWREEWRQQSRRACSIKHLQSSRHFFLDAARAEGPCPTPERSSFLDPNHCCSNRQMIRQFGMDAVSRPERSRHAAFIDGNNTLFVWGGYQVRDVGV